MKISVFLKCDKTEKHWLKSSVRAVKGMEWLHQIGFVSPIICIPELWHSLNPLGNNGSSVAVASPVGRALYYALRVLFIWKITSLRSAMGKKASLLYNRVFNGRTESAAGNN